MALDSRWSMRVRRPQPAKSIWLFITTTRFFISTNKHETSHVSYCAQWFPYQVSIIWSWPASNVSSYCQLRRKAISQTSFQSIHGRATVLNWSLHLWQTASHHIVIQSIHLIAKLERVRQTASLQNVGSNEQQPFFKAFTAEQLSINFSLHFMTDSKSTYCHSLYSFNINTRTSATDGKS